MKKKLFALAVAGALAAPVAAMADTTIYGVAHASYDATTTGDYSAIGAASAVTPVGVRASANQNKVSSNQSRIGIKGTEDLGGGMSAIYQIESSINMDGTTGSTLAGRNTFVGLSGESWGTVLLGRNDTPYKASTRKLDLFADTIADNRSLTGAGILGFDNRNTDVLQYNSPNLSGFTVSAQYTLGAEAVTAGSTKGNAVSLGLGYEAGPLYVAFGYQSNTFGEAGTGAVAPAVSYRDRKESAWKLGGSYTMDQFQVNAVYESTTDDLTQTQCTALATAMFGATVATGGSSDCLGHKTFSLGGKYNVSSSDSIKLAYTKQNELKLGGLSSSKTAAKQISLGYDHAMSKRTTVYALYTKLDNEDNSAAELGGQPGASSTSTGSVAPQFGADPKSFSLGLKHTF